MNAIEKIIAAHAGLKTVKPGQIVDVKLDYVMANNATTTLSIDVCKWLPIPLNSMGTLRKILNRGILLPAMIILGADLQGSRLLPF
ncbi:hypothetical protein [Desulfosporosinus sp. BG]|uniref:hypothetical protein n=1 Tax=Desulfosporosinus sp. BG TaxID=1633135 RepID=UPI00083B9201|nr:hypothetical protein [Desulfosporosinus sp. BG]ODA40599.1 3-isopropylmalate dehydratase large subunit [Desulfosporosinus sp. BG]